MNTIRSLPDSRLSAGVMVISAILIVVGTAAAPGEGSPIWVSLVWLAASLALIGVFFGSLLRIG